MAPAEWYYAKENKQYGPVSAAQLKQLAVKGELTPSNLVWREGMDEWITAGKVKGLFDEDAPAPEESRGAPSQPPQPMVPPPPAREPHARRPPAHLFDLLLEFARGQFTGRFVKSTTKLFTICGHYGLYVAMLLLFGLNLIVGVKTNSLNTVLLAVAWVLGLVVLQYAASRFSRALERLNRTTSGQIESTAFPDCFALLNMVVGIVALLGLTVVAVQTGLFVLLLPGIGAFILCQYLAIVALNPETLSLNVAAEAPAGEEAIGLLSFFVKLGLRLVPVAFGVGVASGTLWLLLVGCLMLFFAGAGDVPPGTGDQAAAFALVQFALLPAELLIVVSAVLPLLYYVFFLFCHVLIDVVRAILSLPGKLDKLVEPEETVKPEEE